jgi:hypothetical protein
VYTRAGPHDVTRTARRPDAPPEPRSRDPVRARLRGAAVIAAMAVAIGGSVALAPEAPGYDADAGAVGGETHSPAEGSPTTDAVDALDRAGTARASGEADEARAASNGLHPTEDAPPEGSKPHASNTRHGMNGAGAAGRADTRGARDETDGPGATATASAAATADAHEAADAVDADAHDAPGPEPAATASADAPTSSRRTRTALLHVVVVPFGDVWVDGRHVGPSPARLRVPAGLHTVATGDGAPERSTRVRLAPGERRRVVLE